MTIILFFCSIPVSIGLFFASCYVLFVNLYLICFTLPFYTIFVFFFLFRIFLKSWIQRAHLTTNTTHSLKLFSLFYFIFFFQRSCNRSINLLKIFYRSSKVDKITNTRHDSWTSHCIPEKKVHNTIKKNKKKIHNLFNSF